MNYKKAEDVLPQEVIELIQKYVDGQCIYIHRIENKRKSWGSDTDIRRELSERNRKIYYDFLSGMMVSELAARYFLSIKSIQRIVLKMKNTA